MASPLQSSDLTEVKQQQQKVWSQGDYAAIATQLVIVSENLCERVDLRAGSRVLDVACGSGNTSIAAARRNCDVTGVDFAPSLLERAQERAAAERLSIRFEHGDAEHLPYRDASFDVVLSTFGVMFASNQMRAAAELLRVCRPGGMVGMANWTPDGWSATPSRIRARFLPSPPGTSPPMRWGTETGIRELFGDGLTDVRIERRECVYRYRSPAHWLEFVRVNYGPTVATFAALDSTSQQQFADALLEAVAAANTATDGTLVVPAGYLELIARRA